MKNVNILVIPKESYLAVKKDPRISIKDVVNSDGFYKLRPEAELDENYLQIIPYLYVTKGDSVFLYKRLKAGTEARLHDNYSIGIGGHVDEDSKLGIVDIEISNWAQVELAADRELNEELELHNDNYTLEFSEHLIYDDSNPVGRVHLGIAGRCSLFHDNDLKVREVNKIEGQFTSISKIKSLHNKLENWSNILIDLYKL